MTRLGASGVALAFLNSAECRAMEIRTYYSTLLGRTTAPVQSDVNYWVSSGLDMMTIRLMFETSGEFAFKACVDPLATLTSSPENHL